MWFWKIMIRFFIAIDKNLFNFISTLYDLLIAISRSSVLSQGDIAQFATRVEILLGIFMLFKVSFSLITYIVNPDDFTDKQKGFGKLVQNSVISLTLLVLVPYIFQMAFSLQAKVLNDNILAKLLLGEKINPETSSTNTEQEVSNNATIVDTAGNQMAFYVMLPFFLPNTSISELNDCINVYENNNFNGKCYDALKAVGVSNADANNYKYGIEYESLGLTFRANIALTDTDDRFVIDYKYPLSTATAVITCLLLITFCIDVGVRSVKLAFLQLVYPIPVISFMDPKSGKDGIFSKWYKMCLTTFLSLFIRLLALYFGIYVISRVGRHGIVDNINGSEITNGWVKLFVIIGILMFVKQLPKLLENLGIKLDGDGKFTLNPLKKVFDENNGMFGAKGIKRAGVAAGAAGLVGAAAMGSKMLSAPNRLKNAQGVRGKLRALANTFTGGISTMGRAAFAGAKGEKFGKAYTNSYSTAQQRMKKTQARADAGVGGIGAKITSAQKTLGMTTRNDKIEKLKSLEKDIHSNYEALKNQANATDTNSFTASDGNTYNGAKDLSKRIETLRNGKLSRDSYSSDAEFNDALINRERAIKSLEDILDDRYDQLSNDSSSIYGKLRSNMENSANKANKLSKQFDLDVGEIKLDGSVKDIDGTAKSIDTGLMGSKKVSRASATEEYLKREK